MKKIQVGIMGILKGQRAKKAWQAIGTACTKALCVCRKRDTATELEPGKAGQDEAGK